MKVETGSICSYDAGTLLVEQYCRQLEGNDEDKSECLAQGDNVINVDEVGLARAIAANKRHHVERDQDL